MAREGELKLSCKVHLLRKEFHVLKLEVLEIMTVVTNTIQENSNDEQYAGTTTLPITSG